MEWMEHLGVETLGVIPVAAGLGASVEMIGLVDFPTLLSLSLVAGGVTLFHWCNRSLKNAHRIFLESSMAEHQPVAQNEKVETWV